ncbi:MAG: hypothetical protein NWE89_15215 [Candidatus Bathyarchaeota archaeon]|nr:hypothetical protein [Candidatus Bathyarchaeota archaeon]
MNKLFGSKTRTSLITKFMMEPDRAFYIRELSRETHIPYSMVHKELDNLTGLGIITREKKGNLTLITANKELPIFNDLRNIIIKTTGIYHVIRDRVQGDIKYMLVFGSIASHDDNPQSDLDLMIIGNIDEWKLIETLNDIEKETHRQINYISWTHNEFQKKIKENNHILLDISEKPVIMLEGNEDEFRQAIKRRNNPQNQAQ